LLFDGSDRLSDPPQSQRAAEVSHRYFEPRFIVKVRFEVVVGAMMVFYS